MITTGNVTKFEHCRKYNGNYDSNVSYLIVVVFDGEPELWEPQDDKRLPEALGEIKAYYRRDWAGTGRVIPINVYQRDPITTTVIDAL